MRILSQFYAYSVDNNSFTSRPRTLSAIERKINITIFAELFERLLGLRIPSRDNISKNVLSTGVDLSVFYRFCDATAFSCCTNNPVFK